MLITILLGCLLIPVPAELRELYCQVTWDWGYPPAEVREVRWCQDDCEKIKASGGGMFEVRTRTIILDPDRVNPQLMHSDYHGIRQIQERYLLLLHEYGHALGLGHRDHGIMKPGWDTPVLSRVEEEDREFLRNLKKTP